MERFLWVCLGGAVGTGVRYLVTLACTQRLGTAFPYGTLAVNVGGCFVMGLVMAVVTRVPFFPPNLRFALTAGFLGGLTTYSSFNYETSALLRDGAALPAAINFGATVIGCFVAGLLGVSVGNRLA